MRVEGETWRLSLADGRATTVHTASYSLAGTRAEVVHITPEAPLEVWCDRSGIRDAISGGFSVKNEGQTTHGLAIVKSPAQAPGGMLDETSFLARGNNLAGGEAETLAADLKPGEYELVCLVPGHYMAGQKLKFTVSP